MNIADKKDSTCSKIAELSFLLNRNQNETYMKINEVFNSSFPFHMPLYKINYSSVQTMYMLIINNLSYRLINNKI